MERLQDGPTRISAQSDWRSMNPQPQYENRGPQTNAQQFNGQGHSNNFSNQPGSGGQQSNGQYPGQDRTYPGSVNVTRPNPNTQFGWAEQTANQGYQNSGNQRLQNDSKTPPQQYVTEWVQQPGLGARDQKSIFSNQPQGQGHYLSNQPQGQGQYLSNQSQGQGQYLSEPYPQVIGATNSRQTPTPSSFDQRGANPDPRGAQFGQQTPTPYSQGTPFDHRDNQPNQRPSSPDYRPATPNTQNPQPWQTTDYRGTYPDQRSSSPDPRDPRTTNTNTNGAQRNLSPAYDRYQSVPQPTYLVRNEFFCDKYDLLSVDKLPLKIGGEVHRSRNLLTGKDVCVWLLPVQDIPDNISAGQNQAVQNHLAFSEGLLSVHESFHDGQKYVLVTEPVQQTFRDYVLGR